MGEGWRDLWTTPIPAPILDLSTEGGGLSDVRQVGGRQSRLLSLRGADGRSYTIRAVMKDQAGLLPPAYRGTDVANVFQDQTASQHPIGSVVAAPLAKAAGILTNEPRLVVVPRDARLGSFQSSFGGILATIEEYPAPASDAYAGFAGAASIVSTRRIWEPWLQEPATRVDARAYLRARLFDFFINDWDRHAGQWRWARVPGDSAFQPIPEDRDQAFSNFGGLVVNQLGPPELLPFEETIPRMHAMAITGWGTDRLILVGLSRETFREEAAILQGRLTDEVIGAGVGLMPRPYVDLAGDRMVRVLRSRRDQLQDAADEFYSHLAREVDVHATHEADEARAVLLQDGTLELTLRRAEVGELGAPAPYFRRVFRPAETDEIRLYLHGGDDRLAGRQAGRSGIRLYVMPGSGADQIELGDGQTHVLESEDEDEVEGNARVDAEPYRNPAPHEEMPWREPRNWGTTTRLRPYLLFERDDLLSIGAALGHTRYAFRRYPFGQQHRARLTYGVGRSTFRLSYHGAFRARNEISRFIEARALFSTSELTNFFGLGNETPKISRELYQSRRPEIRLMPALVYDPRAFLRLRGGVEASFRGEEREEENLASLTRPYGHGSFGQIGLHADVQWDRRNRFPPIEPGEEAWVESDSDALPFWSGHRVRARVRAFPAVWDVEESFLGVEANAARYVPVGRAHSLAMRLGGEKIFGDYPWHEAAVLGGSHQLRAYRRRRFAGDASLYANADWRTRLGRAELFAPGHVGVFALGDVGRVFLRGEDSEKWHPSVGAGVFFVPLNTNFPFHAAVAHGGEGTRIYFDGGFSF